MCCIYRKQCEFATPSSNKTAKLAVKASHYGKLWINSGVVPQASLENTEKSWLNVAIFSIKTCDLKLSVKHFSYLWWHNEI